MNCSLYDVIFFLQKYNCMCMGKSTAKSRDFYEQFIWSVKENIQTY